MVGQHCTREDDPFLALNRLFDAHHYPLDTIPTMFPPLLVSLRTPGDVLLAGPLTTIHQAYWLRYAMSAHYARAQDAQGIAFPDPDEYGTLSWQDHTGTFLDLAMQAVTLRKLACLTTFYAATPGMATTIAEEVARARPGDLDQERHVLLYRALAAMVALREQGTDYFAQPLPAPAGAFAQAWVEAPPYRAPGNICETKRITVGKRGYFAKTLDDQIYDEHDPIWDMRDEAATAAAIRAFGWRGIAPQEAFVLRLADGNAYAITKQLQAVVIDDPIQAALAVTQQAVQQAMIVECLLSIPDRHAANARIHRKNQRICEIDLAGSLQDVPFHQKPTWSSPASSLTRTSHHTRLIWDCHAETRFADDGTPLFLRPLLETAFHRAPAVIAAVRPYVGDADRSRLEHSFAVLQEILASTSSDVSLHTLREAWQP